MLVLGGPHRSSVVNGRCFFIIRLEGTSSATEGLIVPPSLAIDR